VSLAGKATEEGTRRYREARDWPANHFRQAQGLWGSSLGIGTYLGPPDAATDRQVEGAVAAAVRGGINLIDSAINYRRERGERSVGNALRQLVDAGEARRDELILCTKGGFLPQSLGPDWFRARFGGGRVEGMTEEDLVGGCHCLHPAFLEDQLERSLQNLQVETVDIYYLHNPETQLGRVAPDLFESRIAAAFEFLEEAAAAGSIRYYGLATWSGLRLPPGHPQHLPLERMKHLARKAASGREDHLRFVQLPFNLLMPEALVQPTQRVAGETVPVLSAARRLGVDCVFSGSLAQGKAESALNSRLRSLIDGNLSSDSQRALQFARSAPGGFSALVGMKRPAHVRENLALCRQAPLPPETYRSLLPALRVEE